MKRPLCTIGLAFFGSTFVVACLGINTAVSVGLFCLISGLAFVLASRRKNDIDMSLSASRPRREPPGDDKSGISSGEIIPDLPPVTASRNASTTRSWLSGFALVLFSVAFACLSFTVFRLVRYEPIASLSGSTLLFKGVATSSARSGNSVVYEVSGTFPEIAGAPKTIKLRLRSFETIALNPAEQIICRVLLKEPFNPDPDNMYYLARGHFLHGDIVGSVSITPVPDNKSIGYYMTVYRERIKEVIYEALDAPGADLIVAMLMGDRSGIDSDISTDMYRSGLIHLLAISGLHVSILSGAVLKFFRFFGLSRKLAAIATMPVVFLFVGMSGFVFSAVRAGIMTSLFLLSTILSRKSDSLTSLSAAVILIVIQNPYAAVDVGFQLSAASSLGVILFSDKINSLLLSLINLCSKSNAACISSVNSPFHTAESAEHRDSENLVPDCMARLLRVREAGGSCVTPVKKLLAQAIFLIAVSLAAYAFSVPILISSFGYLTVLSPIASVFAMPLAPPAITLGLFGSLFGLIPFLGLFSTLLLKASAFLVNLISGIASVFASLPFSAIPVRHMYQYIWLFIVYAAAIALYLLKATRRTKVMAAVGCVIALSAGVFSVSLLSAGTVELITYRDSGSIVVIKNRAASIIGVPSTPYAGKQIADMLKLRMIDRIDIIAITDATTNDAAGAMPILEYMPPEIIITPETGRYYASIRYLAKSSEIYAADDLTAVMLGDVKLIFKSGANGFTAEIQIGSTSILKAPPDDEINDRFVHINNYDIIYGSDMTPLIIKNAHRNQIISSTPVFTNVVLRG